MFIFFDESYNLHDRSKKQFISINGFVVLNVKILFKKWKELRKPFVGKRRIHATDSGFNKLRLKVLELIRRHDLILLTVFQVVQEIPFQKDKKYFLKNKLNFEKIYLDLLKALFKELDLNEYKSINIVIDNRKHKRGVLGKKYFKKEILNFLKKNCPKTQVNFEIQSSTSNILLELADFISSIFYRAYLNNNEELFEELKFKMAQIKNPL